MSHFSDLTKRKLAEEALRQANESLCRELAECKRAGEELRQNQARLQATIDSITDGLVVLDRNWRYTFFSESGAQMVGMRREDLIGGCIWELFPHAKESQFYTRYHQAVRTGQPVHFEEFYPEPLDKWLECHCYPSAEGLSVYFRDITERKQAEEAQARLAAIVASSEDAILSKTLDGTIRTWNAGAQRMFGYRAEEVIGQRVTLLIPPERVDEETQVLERLKRGETIEHYETVRLTKSGRRLDVSLTISPLKDNQGRITGASKIARDIGEIVRARQVLAQNKEDLERLVEERTAKLQAALGDLEHMSYSMVHDLRAPLRAMQSYAMILQQECTGCLRPQSLEHLRRIREAADRLDRLLTDALNYNQIARQELPVTPVEVGKLLRSLLETYPSLQPLASDIHIEFKELVVLGNESLLTQCFGNLLDNAIKFVAPGVKPRIRVWAQGGVDTETLPASPRLPVAASSPGVSASCVRIWIEDNGIGIPKAAQAKLFHMFQRMHRASEYPGTGIGLAIVRKAAERMGGLAGLESEPGQGSRFWIQLPSPGAAKNDAPLEAAA